MSLEETTAPPSRRRRAELPPARPLMERELIFVTDIIPLAREVGKPHPGQGTITKLCSKAGREAGLSPRISGFLGKRPTMTPADALEWLDGLVKPESIAMSAAFNAATRVPVDAEVASPGNRRIGSQGKQSF